VENNIMKTLREYIDQLDEISRRDLLRGAGATAGLAVTDAISAPFKHITHIDQMTNEPTGKYTIVKSDNNQASIIILNRDELGGVTIIVPGYIDADIKTRGIFPLQAQGRIKFGNGPVLSVTFSQLSIGNTAVISTPGIGKKILTHAGEMKIEIPLSRSGVVVYKFTLEPDTISREQSKNLKELADPHAIDRIEKLVKYK
jgi:hypothetical protein